MVSLRASAVPLCLATAVASVLAMTSTRSAAATYVWGGGTGNWTSGASWQGGLAPSGSNSTDILTFGGDVGTVYTTTNNFGSAVSVNQLVLQATGSGSGTHTIAATPGSRIALEGTTPQIIQNGAGGFNVSSPVELRANTTFGGNGAGVVTLNGAVSGNFDITKTGASTFRFGSLGGDADPSTNTWFGTLNHQGGTIRFNNNLSTGRTALRGNPVALSSGALLTASSEIRLGTLSGAGSISTSLDGSEANSIVIHALQDGTFSGALGIATPTGNGNEGSLVVRGPGTQRFTGGTLGLGGGDVVVGAGSTVILSGSASLAGESKGGVTLAGGTFILDNLSGGNNSNRLRGSSVDSDSTGLETIGGGKFTLIGSASGTQEAMARLQLGSINNSNTVSTARSGALTLNIVHNATNAPTTLSFAAYTRNGLTTTASALQFATVNFTAEDGSGNKLALGQTGNNPRILISGSGFTVPLSGATLTGHKLMTSTGGAVDLGWATINGSDFASYDSANGVVAAATSNFPASGGGNAASNYLLTAASSNAFIATNFSAQSLKIAPAVANRNLSLGSGLSLTTQGYLLAGDIDFSIVGAGSIAGTSSRYFYVDKANLTVSARIGGSGAIVKSGAGTLTLSNINNPSNTSMVVINEGQVRASVAPSIASLPNGEMRFRGGVLEITGGGTFSRTVGTGNGSVNWNGFDGAFPVNTDRGSGGFAAVGDDVVVDLGGAGATSFVWEGNSFVNSGHALIFGSRAATHKVNWVDNIGLTGSGTSNYNAREVRVIGHADPEITTDRLQLSGAISGAIYNDLVKTGDGVLELSGVNGFQGATIVHGGTLLVNGENTDTFLTQVKSGARLGGIGKVRTTRVESGGVLSPGEISGASRTGQLTINGDLAFGAASKLEIEVALGAHDRVAVNGSVKLDGAELVGSLLNGFLAAPLDLFFLIINDGSDAVQGTFAQGGFVSFGGQGFEISYTGNFENQTFTGGNDIVLRAVPEPSTGLLAGAAALLGGMRRLRRTRITI